MSAPRLPPFQRLLDEHGSDVLGFLVAAVGPHDAEDCFQETMVSALRAYDDLLGESNLRGWLLTIAHHKAIDHHRAGKRRPEPRAELPDRGAADPRHSSDPAADRKLWGLVGSLPAKQRLAVALRFAADMPYRQIGMTIDCSEEAARRSVHEGLKTLREELV